MANGAQPHNYISCAVVLVVSDIHASVEFYRDNLGFEIAQLFGEPPSFAIANSPYASIMLKQGSSGKANGDLVPNTARVSGLWDAYVWIRDLDELTTDLGKRGTVHHGPDLQEYGCSEITVTDPDGYVICFGYCP